MCACVRACVRVCVRVCVCACVCTSMYADVEATLPTVTIEAVAGQNISLLCSMASFPPDVMLSYSWYRGAAISSSRILPQASQAYSVVNTSQSDAGSYLCSASNGYASGEVIFEVVVLSMCVCVCGGGGGGWMDGEVYMCALCTHYYVCICTHSIHTHMHTYMYTWVF